MDRRQSVNGGALAPVLNSADAVLAPLAQARGGQKYAGRGKIISFTILRTGVLWLFFEAQE
jgi:hypothetical protein